MFEILIVKCERFESFLEISGIYPMTKVRRFLLLFENMEDIFAIILEKEEKDNKYDTDDKS